MRFVFPSPQNHRPWPNWPSAVYGLTQGLNEKFALRALKEEQQAQEAFLWATEEDALSLQVTATGEITSQQHLLLGDLIAFLLKNPSDLG